MEMEGQGLAWTRPGLDKAWPGQGLAWTGLAWTGLAWTGLAWIGLAWPGQAWEPKSQFFDEKKRPCEERSPGPEGLESPENQFFVKIEPKLVWMVGFGVRYRQSGAKLRYECIGIPPTP